MPLPRLRRRASSSDEPLLAQQKDQPVEVSVRHAKIRTVSFEELAVWRQDNRAILTGYRAEVEEWTACFATIWWWHNETGRPKSE